MKPFGPHIKTTYHPDGTVKVEPVGYPGGQCHRVTAPYQAAYGQPVQTTPTDEARLPEPAKVYGEEQNQQEIA